MAARTSQRLRSAGATRPVVIVGYADAQTLDITGPFEVFSAANRLLLRLHGAPAAPYAVRLAAPARGPIRMSSGLGLVADAAVADLRVPLDTLIVAGGIGSEAASRDERLLRWLKRTAPRVRRLASVCTGAFVLGAAGLLDGRRATTHWAACERLAREYPGVEVEPDAIYVRDGDLWTSAGVTAGMDLALAMVEEDLGRELALTVARWLVVFLKRPGGQSQFSAQLAAQLADRAPLKDLQGWIADHPGADLSVEALAARVGMSPRNFARVFTREVGATPARFVERVRVEAARRRLEETADGVEAVAASVGFGTAETMRRAFVRVLGVSPQDYRSRFRQTA